MNFLRFAFFLFGVAIFAENVAAQDRLSGRNIIIYDGSYSMQQKRSADGIKFDELARRAASALVEGHRDIEGVEVGLLTFGTNIERLDDCTNFRVTHPIAPARSEHISRIQNEIAGSVSNGQTPLARSIELAYSELGREDGTIIILTDFNGDSCDGDPCEMARSMAAKYGNQVDFVIGMGEATQAEQLAQCTGARYLQIDSAADIAREIGKILKEIAMQMAADRTGDLSVSFALESEALFLGVTPPMSVSIRPRSGGGQINLDGPKVVTDLSPGLYSVSAYVGGARTGELAVNVHAGMTSRVVFVANAPRIDMSVASDGSSAKDVFWTVEHKDTGQTMQFEGHSLVQNVAPGEYRIELVVGEQRRPLNVNLGWNQVHHRVY